ncbi:MAG: integrin alpha [Planctomycetota bacterium]|jgi:hypothetical protein|nr:integrin alpha [Planctomycetota bacterium]MDP6763781.1 integrin alpha [Planctomycetota bacterium]MDP6989568.1 integrin alpha [Planctomycetota bacterium]
MQRSPIPTVLACLLLTAPASAQALQHTFAGEDVQDHFGYAVAGGHDFDLDGHDDLIVSAVFYLTQEGYVRVLSGRTGEVIYAIESEHLNAGFGSDVTGLGDVNGDGVEDILIGAYWDSIDVHYAGGVHVYSGRSGELLYALSGTDAFDLFGKAVDSAGDVDADGTPDFIVGGPGSDRNGDSTGSAWVCSGADGSFLLELVGDQAGDRLGFSVAGIGDVDLDGHDDLLVGGFPTSGSRAGYARVFSGADGSAIRTHAGALQSATGSSVCGLGDVDGDGAADYAVGAYLDRDPADSSLIRGSVTVYSGASGGELYKLWGDPDSTLGWSCDGPGDVDGDGVGDLVVGAPSVDTCAGAQRYAAVHSGPDGSLLFRVEGEDVQFAFAVRGAGDVNGDGLADVAIGSLKESGAAENAGAAYVYLGGCPAPTTYCSGEPNSAGAGASIASAGGPSLSIDQLSLLVTGAVPGQVGLFFYGAPSAAVPFGDGVRCAGLPAWRLAPMVVDGDGSAECALDCSAPPAGSGPGQLVPGVPRGFQFWYRDPVGGGLGFNLSDALLLTPCP